MEWNSDTTDTTGPSVIGCDRWHGMSYKLLHADTLWRHGCTSSVVPRVVQGEMRWQLEWKNRMDGMMTLGMLRE